MNAMAMINTEHTTNAFDKIAVTKAIEATVVTKEQIRSSVAATNPQVLADIYQNNINMTIWQRKHSSQLNSAVTCFIAENFVKPTRLTVSPEDAFDVLCDTFGDSHAAVTLNKDIALLVGMFCCLFGLKYAGIRLAILDKAMCPRFHVDRIPCRLITTYQGIGTQWLEHVVVDREKLGAGNQGKSDEESGLFHGLHNINKLNAGDVALLKGENWDDTKGFGLVHRSPIVSSGEHRLVLTLDFIDE